LRMTLHLDATSNFTFAPDFYPFVLHKSQLFLV
jgi:hypothetical protein